MTAAAAEADWGDAIFDALVRTAARSGYDEDRFVRLCQFRSQLTSAECVGLWANLERVARKLMHVGGREPFDAVRWMIGTAFPLADVLSYGSDEGALRERLREEQRLDLLYERLTEVQRDMRDDRFRSLPKRRRLGP